MKALIKSVRGMTPEIDESCFVAETATVIGNVKIAEKSSIWYGVVIRGDVAPIRVGREVNIQDGTVVHGTYERASLKSPNKASPKSPHKEGKNYGVTLGDRVTIGHLVMLHGCQVDRGSLIGMGSIVMDGVHVGEHCLVGAGSLLTEGSKFPPRSLILGRPAKVKRELTAEEIALLEHSADNYLLYKTWY
jgi:carbonic anhydrase/acetyltransferase-like protein (isoleucine patch superfamily)